MKILKTYSEFLLENQFSNRNSEYEQNSIKENYKNLQTDSQKQPFVDEVWNLLQSAYEKIGGIKGNGFKSKEDMIQNIPFWKIKTNTDNSVTSVLLYKIKDGLRKTVALATNGTLEGKEDLKKMMKEDMTRSMCEISDSTLKFVQRNMPHELEKYKIPFEVADKILHDDEMIPVDDYFYQRKIGGHLHTKLLVGTPSKFNSRQAPNL
jgi:hypothetical protein